MLSVLSDTHPSFHPYTASLLGHSAILLNGPPKHEACWSDRLQEFCEGLILAVSIPVRHDQDLNPGYFNLELSPLAIELSRYTFDHI